MFTPASAVRPITGRFVLIAMVSFFAVVISVNTVMMRLAISTLPGTEVDNAYSAGLAYQREIRAAKQQDNRNWKMDAHVELNADGAAQLSLGARTADGRPLTGLLVIGRLERPTDRRQDRQIDISESGGGRYRGVARDVARGQWDLVLEAESKGQRVFMSRNRLVLN